MVKCTAIALNEGSLICRNPELLRLCCPGVIHKFHKLPQLLLLDPAGGNEVPKDCGTPREAATAIPVIFIVMPLFII